MKALEKHPKSGDIYVVEYDDDLPVGLSDSLHYEEIRMIVSGDKDIDDVSVELFADAVRDYVSQLARY